MEIFQIVTLSLSGLLLTFVGLMRLTNPIKTYANNSGINLQKDVELLNEIRGLSAVQLTAGTIIILGIFASSITPFSFLAASLIFVGFALGRLISMGVDGKPNSKLVQGLIFELVFGAANAFCFFNTI